MWSLTSAFQGIFRAYKHSTAVICLQIVLRSDIPSPIVVLDGHAVIQSISDVLYMYCTHVSSLSWPKKIMTAHEEAAVSLPSMLCLQAIMAAAVCTATLLAPPMS